jgi:hypothetical protein
MNNDVDVNILIQNYHNKISTLYNQNILLETKLQSMAQDFNKEKEILIMKNLELQTEIDNYKKTATVKKQTSKFINAEVE